MIEALEAKFNLQHGATIEEYFNDTFIKTDLFPDLIYTKFENLANNYEDIVREEVEEVYGEAKYDDETGAYIHPQTEDPIYYDNWDEWWTDMIDEIMEELSDEFMYVISENITDTYAGLLTLFAYEANLYLQESLDDEWHNYK